MFSFSPSESAGRGRILLTAPECDWSNAISIDAVGGLSSNIRIRPHKRQDYLVALQCNVSLGADKYALTKLVNITPMYMLKNNCDLCLNILISNSISNPNMISNHTSTSNTISNHSIAPKGIVALLYVPVEDESRMISLSAPPLFPQWTAMVRFAAVGRCHVKLTNHQEMREMLLRIDIATEGGVQYIVCSEEKSSWPFRIDNRSSHDIVVNQKVCYAIIIGYLLSHYNNFQGSKAKYRVKAAESMVYTWDEPAFDDKFLVLHFAGQQREINIQEIGPQLPLSIPRAVRYLL